MSINKLKEYEVIEEKNIEDLNSKGYMLKHKKAPQSGYAVLWSFLTIDY